MIIKDSLVFRRQVIDELSGETDYGDKLTGITRWGGDPAKQPTEEAIQAKLAELQAEYDAQAYARSRQAEYPPLEEQLDHIYHNGVESWKTNMVKPVKDKYPKPG